MQQTVSMVFRDFRHWWMRIEFLVMYPGHLIPFEFLSPLFSRHHIWTAPTACTSNNSWNPHVHFRSKKSGEILPSTLVSFDGSSFKRSNWEQKIEQYRTKLFEQNFWNKFCAAFTNRNAPRQEKLIISENLSKNHKPMFWGKKAVRLQWNQVSLHPWDVLKQSLHSFCNHNCAKTRQLKYSWKPSRNPKNADRS